MLLQQHRHGGLWKSAGCLVRKMDCALFPHPEPLPRGEGEPSSGFWKIRTLRSPHRRETIRSLEADPFLLAREREQQPTKVHLTQSGWAKSVSAKSRDRNHFCAVLVSSMACAPA